MLVVPMTESGLESPPDGANHAAKHAAKHRPDRRSTMSSSLKCFQALEVLASPPYEFSLTDIALELSLPVASAHRIMTTLCVAGAAEQHDKTKWYRLTGRTLWIGTGYLRRSAVYRAAFVLLQEMARKCHEQGMREALAYLATIDNDQVLYLHTVGNPTALSLYANTGERRPMHSTGLGKALLAFQPKEVENRVLSGKLAKSGPRTITSVAALREELALIRQRGYAVDDEENVRGTRCVAAPILDQPGHAIAAMSISGPVGAFQEQMIEPYSRIVRDAALRVSVQIGYRSQTSQIHL
jgi:DNA-binding IclR family transcriptional regulator